MSKELIRLRDCVMSYGDEVVLDHINLYINDREFLTLLGPSGCGKTTTLRIIGGFLLPTAGDVLFDGVRINDVPPPPADGEHRIPAVRPVSAPQRV